MALSDYNPVLQYYADSLTDLDEPTGTTKSNPGALTDPTVAGTPDAYLDCSGSTAVNFLPSTAVFNPGTGDMTLVAKFRVGTWAANDVLFSNYNGSAVSPNVGMRIIITSGANRRLALEANGRSGFMCESASSALPAAGTDFIVAWRKSSGTWTMWADVDASGGMSAISTLANNIGTSSFTEGGDITFGSDRGGTGPTDCRIYWLVGFNEAIDDTTIALVDWDTESNLKSAWLSAGGTVNTQTLSSTIALNDEPLDYVFFNRIVEDSVVLTDELVATVIGTIARTLTDTLDITDGAQWFIYRTRLLQDSILVSEGATEQYVNTNIVIDDTVDVIDAVIRYARFTRLGTDSLVISDSLISSLVNYVIQSAVLSSTISVTDAEQHFLRVTRVAQSLLSLFDENLTAMQRFILLTDAVELLDESQLSRLRVALLSDGLSLDDSATATYIPDDGEPDTVFNPVIRIGFDQPRIDIGGYALN